MQTTEALGFKLRGSESWIFIPAKNVDCVYGGKYEYSVLVTKSGQSFELDGTPNGIASVIWPVND